MTDADYREQENSFLAEEGIKQPTSRFPLPHQRKKLFDTLIAQMRAVAIEENLSVGDYEKRLRWLVDFLVELKQSLSLEKEDLCEA